ncbi:hypothetical protein [Dyadobacter sp. NIV53]|uniref:hypothetical protein n=1 Tax=Dyadobacter sp. NIV53 TaxID=2861765 RepID=UPI001C8796C5|nr:hypothetical protein [Dyadobacter sp. NIV53]
MIKIINLQVIRLKVTVKSLEEIFGYNEKGSFDKINSPVTLALWIRDAIDFVLAEQLRDHHEIHIISLRNGTSDIDWQTSIKSKKIIFKTIPSDFKLERVRFRSISASVVGPITFPKSPFSLSVHFPKTGIYIFENNRKLIDQSKLPVCLIGRVENIQSNREVEICGGVIFNNASPICSEDTFFEINIEQLPSASDKIEDAEDILIELHVVGIN